jgi:hypothetical protein
MQQGKSFQPIQPQLVCLACLLILGWCIKQIAWPVGHDSGALAVCLPCDLDRGATLCWAIVAFQVQGKHRVDALGYNCLTLVVLLFVHWLVLVQNVNVYAWGVWVIEFVYNCELYNILRHKESTQLWPDFFFQINILVCWFVYLSCNVSDWLDSALCRNPLLLIHSLHSKL